MTPASKPEPSRIGSARPSQLMTTGGVGAVVDLPGLSVIVRGLESWQGGGTLVSEPRLLQQVQRALPGAGVSQLRAAPSDHGSSDDPYARIGVPVTTFPRWLRCPACHQVWPIDGTDQFALHHRWGRRPDLAKWTHTQCSKQSVAPSRRRACIPARFVVVCKNGHLDEFPYAAFVHAEATTTTCPGAKLEMRDAGSTLGPRVLVTCLACDTRRNISDASGTRGANNLPRCRGRHPHLQTFSSCDAPLKLMVLGASNLWFSVSASALHLPQEEPILGLLHDHWDVLSAQPTAAVLAAVVAAIPELSELRDRSADELWALVVAEKERRSQMGDSPAAEPADLLDEEWSLLCHPTTTDHDGDFLAEPTPVPADYARMLEQVVQVKRLREVQALLGFTRVEGPAPGEIAPARIVPLSAPGRSSWVPAVERRGEGLFLQLREELVAAWVAKVAEHPHVIALHGAHARWLVNRDLAPRPDFPLPRYLLLHTLSHLLLRQVALECGYSSASIRERLYVGSTAAPTAGILLSTAASDTEGTLGGLVALGQASFLGRLLEEALADAATCSSDPLCGERLPSSPSDVLHAAACHACLFASETSCEGGNRFLHRGVLVDIVPGLSLL